MKRRCISAIHFQSGSAVNCLVLTTRCQLDYELDVVVRDGHIDFHVYQKGFGPNKNGQELSNIRYGKVPLGLRQTMPAEPLKVGQLYVVALNALGGMEIAYFVISPSDRPVTALQSAS